MKAPADWVQKMADELPHHMDQYFVSLNNAFAGTYKTQADLEKEDEKRGPIPRALDALSKFVRNKPKEK